mgnify:CR=1 FL=1
MEPLLLVAALLASGLADTPASSRAVGVGRSAAIRVRTLPRGWARVTALPKVIDSFAVIQTSRLAVNKFKTSR